MCESNFTEVQAGGIDLRQRAIGFQQHNRFILTTFEPP